jgi:hypothetical protein
MRPRRSVLLIPSKAACVSNSFPFKWLPTLSCPERKRGVRSRFISFVFKSLRTLFRNGALPTPLPPITSALFPMQWGVGVYSHQRTSNLPYVLPSSVSSKSRVFTLFKKQLGCGVVLPILEPGCSAVSHANVSLVTFVPRIQATRSAACVRRELLLIPTANRERQTANLRSRTQLTHWRYNPSSQGGRHHV